MKDWSTCLRQEELVLRLKKKQKKTRMEDTLEDGG